MLPKLEYAPLCLLLLWPPALGRRLVQNETDAPNLAATRWPLPCKMKGLAPPTIMGFWGEGQKVVHNSGAGYMTLTHRFGTPSFSSVGGKRLNSCELLALAIALSRTGYQNFSFRGFGNGSSAHRVKLMSLYDQNFKRVTRMESQATGFYDKKNGNRVYQFLWQIRVGGVPWAQGAEDLLIQGNTVPKCLPGESLADPWLDYDNSQYTNCLPELIKEKHWCQGGRKPMGSDGGNGYPSLADCAIEVQEDPDCGMYFDYSFAQNQCKCSRKTEGSKCHSSHNPSSRQASVYKLFKRFNGVPELIKSKAYCGGDRRAVNYPGDGKGYGTLEECSLAVAQNKQCSLFFDYSVGTAHCKCALDTAKGNCKTTIDYNSDWKVYKNMRKT